MLPGPFIQYAASQFLYLATRFSPNASPEIALRTGFASPNIANTAHYGGVAVANSNIIPQTVSTMPGLISKTYAQHNPGYSDNRAIMRWHGLG